ncbi:hypothetical protein UF37_13180, partial [Vibrio parahaemolyticus]
TASRALLGTCHNSAPSVYMTNGKRKCVEVAVFSAVQHKTHVAFFLVTCFVNQSNLVLGVIDFK